VHGLADVGAVSAQSEQAHQAPHGLDLGADSQAGDLDAGGGVQVASGRLALGELPVAQQHHEVSLLGALRLHESLAVDGHDLVALVEARGLGELHVLGAQVQGGGRVVGQLPVQGAADMHAVGAHLLQLRRTERCVDHGARKSSRDLTVHNIFKKVKRMNASNKVV
jgi:hypothetical protein